MSEDRSVSRRGFLRGTAGATVAAGATGVAGAQDHDDSGGQEDGDDAGGGGSETVSLVDYAFEPGTDSPLYITPGTEVTFVWETSTHNIVVDSQPADAEWEGHEDIENEGFEYSHTFEVEGEYEFHCQPHINQGMEGTIVVNEEGAPPSGDGGGPAVSDSAKTLGVATFIAMGSTLGLAFFLLKYGGGSPRDVE